MVHPAQASGADLDPDHAALDTSRLTGADPDKRVSDRAGIGRVSDTSPPATERLERIALYARAGYFHMHTTLDMMHTVGEIPLD